MMECSGHYVYYEKNVEMQNYMISTRKKVGFTPSEIIEDRVTKNFRSIIREKNEKSEKKNHSRMVYAMSTFLVLVIVVIGVTMLNNYDKMQNVQNSIDVLSGGGSTEDEDKAVEALGENVTALIDEEEATDKTEIQESESEITQPDSSQSTESETDKTEAEITQPEETTTITPPKTYVVKKGDTLETISRKTYGDITHVDAICKINGLNDGNFIYIGQKLLLP